MKIAFLVMNHRPAAQLLRLLAMLRRQLPGAPIVVHHDRFGAGIEASALDRIENAHLLTSENAIRWGDFSFVDAYWRSLAWMIEHIEFDWVVLLSGQDYPIKPLSTLGDYLSAIGADAFVRAVPISELSNVADRRNRNRRYLYQYRPLTTSSQAEQLSGRLRRRVRQGATRIGREGLLRRFRSAAQTSRPSPDRGA